ncbi:hypothetical protein [Variovorax sp. KK3]|nr:hypothetical protein [Variovorax sp. KK3]
MSAIEMLQSERCVASVLGSSYASAVEIPFGLSEGDVPLFAALPELVNI